LNRIIWYKKVPSGKGECKFKIMFLDKVLMDIVYDLLLNNAVWMLLEMGRGGPGMHLGVLIQFIKN
jgi:hypothetical protein